MIKRSLFVSLIATTFAVNASSLEVYGKANISVNMDKLEGSVDPNNLDGETTKLNSNASRIGFKGSIDIGEGLKAIYKFEYETMLDDGDKDGQTFSQRNIAAGFKGAFGSIIAGKHDTPTKLAQGKVDLFNDLPNADIKNVIQVGEDRTNNIIIYTSPSINGLKASIAYIPDESKNDNTISTSSSIEYKLNDLKLTAAYNDGTAIKSGIRSLSRYVAEYKSGDFKFGAIFQSVNTSDKAGVKAENLESNIVSVSYNLNDKIKLKAQIGEADYYNDFDNLGTPDSGAKEFSQEAFGIDYRLNKKSKLFAYYSNIETDDAENLDSTNAVVSAQNDSNNSTIGLGYEIKF